MCMKLHLNTPDIANTICAAKFRSFRTTFKIKLFLSFSFNWKNIMMLQKQTIKNLFLI